MNFIERQLDENILLLPKKDQFIRYGLAALVSIGMLFIQSLFSDFVGTRYLFIYPTVFLIAWNLGVGPGILSLALSSILFIYYIVMPANDFIIGQTEFFHFSIFSMSSFFVLWIIDRGHKVEERLRGSHELFKISLSSVADAIIVTDKHQRVYFMNNLAEQLLGIKLEDARTKPLDCILTLSSSLVAQSFFLNIEDMLDQKRTQSFRTVSSLGRNSYQVPVEINCTAITSPLKFGTHGVVLTVRDLSEKQKNEATLAASEERLRLATDVSKIGIWELNLITEQAITNFNHDKAFGFTSPVLSWSLSDFISFIHPEDNQMVLDAFKVTAENSSSLDVNFRVVWADTSIHWMNITGHVETDKNGKPIRLIGTNMDITEKKQAEEMLHEALFYRDEFLSIASHELKTPLTSLKLQSQIFKRNVEKNDPQAYSHDRIDRIVNQTDQQVSRLVRLVDDMLDISRIRTGRLSISTEKVALGPLVRDVLERVKPQFQQISITQLDDCTIDCDRLRIEQVLNNILGNAQRYGKGSPVEIAVTNTQESVSVSIRDFGMGIAKENQQKIFSRFQRAVPASEISGLGLGLYIAKQIVDAHHGSIQVESELNQGALFTVTLPLESLHE